MTRAKATLILEQDPELLKMLVNGADFSRGPSPVTEKDRQSAPAIYRDFGDGALYQAVISDKDAEKLVIFNATSVVKKVNMMAMTLG